MPFDPTTASAVEKPRKFDPSTAQPYNPKSISQSGGQDRFISTESDRASWNKPISIVEGAYRMFEDLTPMKMGVNIAEDEMNPKKKGVGAAVQETGEDLSSFARFGTAGVINDIGQAMKGEKPKGKLIPFSPTGAIQSVSILKKVEALRKNKYEDPAQKEADRNAVQDYLLQAEEMNFRNYTVGGKIFKMASESASFAAEFFATGGFGAVAKKSAFKAITKVAGKASESAAKKFTMKVAANSAGGLAQTALMPQRIVSGYGERQIFANVTLTDKGADFLKEATEKPITSLLKAVGDTAIENITENFGGFFFKPIGKAIDAAASKLPSDLVKNVLRAYGEAFPDKKVGDALRAFGFNGILEEMGEERLGDIFRAVTGVQDFGAPGGNALENIIDSFPSAEEWLVEAGVFSLPLVANAATRKVSMMIKKENPEISDLEMLDILSGMSQSEKEAYVADDMKKAEAFADALDKENAQEEKELVKASEEEPEEVPAVKEKAPADDNKQPEEETEKGLAQVYKEMDTARTKRRVEGMKDQEYAGKVSKGAGMVRSAVVRALEGKPTGKEIEKAIERLNSNFIGKIVKTPDGEAVISSPPAYGRFKVRFPNGEQKTFKTDEITSKSAGKEEAIEYLRKEAIKTARLELSVSGMALDKQPKDIDTKKDSEPKEESKKEAGMSEEEIDKIFTGRDDSEAISTAKIDVSKLERLQGGTSRDVYKLGKNRVIKIAKNPKGLEQNSPASDGFIASNEHFPKVYEIGADYIVTENIPRDDKKAREYLKPLQQFTAKDFENKTAELQEVLENLGLSDFMNYDLLWNDFKAYRNWGVRKDGTPVLIDEGALLGNVHSGSEVDPVVKDEWRKILQKRKTGKQQRETAEKSKAESDKLKKQIKPADPKDFHDAIFKADSESKYKGFLTVYPAEEYAGMRVFLNADKTAGYAITKDNEIASLFNTSGVKGLGVEMLKKAISEGGNNLYAFEGFLTETYGKQGFVEAERYKFDDSMAPAGWNYEKFGRPDVIMMKYEGALNDSKSEAGKSGTGTGEPRGDSAATQESGGVRGGSGEGDGTRPAKPRIVAKEPKGKFVTDALGTESFEDTEFFETERKTARLGLGIEAAAIEEGLTERFQGLPEYRTVNMADQARKVRELIESDPEYAFDIAMGRENAPKGILARMVLVGVEVQALNDGDAQRMEDLSRSKLVKESSEFGQEIRALAERSPYSAVAAIQRANENLQRNFEQEKQVSAEKSKRETAKEIKAEIQKKKPKIKDWQAFLEEIKCR